MWLWLRPSSLLVHRSGTLQAAASAESACMFVSESQNVDDLNCIFTTNHFLFVDTLICSMRVPVVWSTGTGWVDVWWVNFFQHFSKTKLKKLTKVFQVPKKEWGLIQMHGSTSTTRESFYYILSFKFQRETTVKKKWP